MKKFSFSRVNSIINCPKKYNEVPFESNEAFQKGLRLHTILETYLKTGFKDQIMMDSLDSDFLDKVIGSLQLNGSEQIISEYHIENDYFKGFVDLIIIDHNHKQLLVLDLKTINDGRKAHYNLNDAEQMRLYAYFINEIFPQYVQAGYSMHIGYILYLKKSKKVKYDTLPVTEADLKITYDNFMKKAKTARMIIDNELWYASKNEYCKFCKLNKTCKGVK